MRKKEWGVTGKHTVNGEHRGVKRTKGNPNLSKHHPFFSYDFHFIDVKRGSYGEAKCRIGVVMSAWLTWIDWAGVVERFPKVPCLPRVRCDRHEGTHGWQLSLSFDRVKTFVG